MAKAKKKRSSRGAGRGFSHSIARLTQTALLMALIVLAVCIPLKILAVEFTVAIIPVAVGAFLLGPSGGAFLGLFYGLCSFAQCFGLFVPSTFGATLLAVSPWLTAVMCILPRLVTGWLAGWVSRALRGRSRTVAAGLTCLTTAVGNTVLFTSAVLLLFGKTEYIASMRDGRSLLAFVAFFVGINGLVEAVVAVVVGTAIIASLSELLHHRA